MTRDVIDIHVHFGAPGNAASGCSWSKAFERSPAYLAVRLVTKSLFRKITIGDSRRNTLEVVNGSRYVRRAVVLALDEVYDSGRRARPERTHLFVRNSVIAALARDDPRVLFGASIHPLRPDWEDEIDSCLENGAVLCKWIPSSQQIDPSSPACVPFFRKLAGEGLPLLCHVGSEGAIPPFDRRSQNLNRPSLLRTALEAGVTVIAAHAALPLLPPPLQSRRFYDELVELFAKSERRGWPLYTDLSAINLGPRPAWVDRIKSDIPSGRLVFGSDYPIPILDISQRPGMDLRQRMKAFAETARVKNPLDKNFLLIKNLGFEDGLFTRASDILRLA
jgi:hypothetical protein